MGKGVNLAGAFNRKDSPLRQLPEKPLALGANFFREVVRRIETILPVEDPDQEPDALIKIIVKRPKGSSPGLVIAAETNIEETILNVCSSGVPSTITVLTKRDD
jgi:hypothetical protein